jgi:tRNA G26 N,N-dimethylase Trm1
MSEKVSILQKCPICKKEYSMFKPVWHTDFKKNESICLQCYEEKLMTPQNTNNNEGNRVWKRIRYIKVIHLQY